MFPKYGNMLDLSSGGENPKIKRLPEGSLKTQFRYSYKTLMQGIRGDLVNFPGGRHERASDHKGRSGLA